MASIDLDTALRDFEEDGVVCLRNVLTPDVVDALRGAIADQIASKGDSVSGYDFESISDQVWRDNTHVSVGEASRFDMDRLKRLVRADIGARPLLEDGEHSDQGMFFYDNAGWRSHAGIRQAAFDSDLPEIAATLLRSSYINFWEDTTFVKAPGTRQKTAFHQDYAYFQIRGTKCIIVWVPLDSVDLNNGVVRYVRGSHKWGRTFAPNMVISQTPTTGALDEKLPDIEADESSWDIISFDVEPGDVLMHHVMTVHGSGGNMSNFNRRAISLRYCGDDIEYYDRPGAIPQVGLTSKLPDGARLYSRDYPLVWPKPWPNFKLSEAFERTQAGDSR